MLILYAKKNKKGFTLIELLVVIAIVGLLTSVALASLNSARKKAADSNIKQNLSGIRSQAEIVFSNNGTEVGYQDLFTASNSVALAMFNAAVTAAQCASACGEKLAEAAGSGVPSSWRAWVPLRTDPTRAWCVDYTGASTVVVIPENPVVPIPPYSCSQL